jgi:hypothetical protein
MQTARDPKEAQHAKYKQKFLADQTLTDFVPVLEKRHRTELSKFPLTQNLKWVEYKGHAQLRLNASELILRVALFEAYMKEIHRHALRARPTILSLSKPKRTVTLKELFAHDFPHFQSSEIDRQVREADHLGTKKLAVFFQRRLKLKWGDADVIEMVCRLVQLRHQIIHQDANAAVSPRDIAEARCLFLSIPKTCFEQALKIYESQFEG